MEKDLGLSGWKKFLEEIIISFIFKKKYGVADNILEKNTSNFLRNIFRKDIPLAPPKPGMLMINLAKAEGPLGEPIMSDKELSVYSSAFEKSGFTGAIN